MFGLGRGKRTRDLLDTIEREGPRVLVMGNHDGVTFQNVALDVIAGGHGADDPAGVASERRLDDAG